MLRGQGLVRVYFQSRKFKAGRPGGESGEQGGEAAGKRETPRRYEAQGGFVDCILGDNNLSKNYKQERARLNLHF